VFLSYLIDRPN